MTNDPFLDSRLMGDGTTLGEPIYNEVIARIAGGMGRVKSATVATPPGTNALHDAYIIPAGATDDWIGKTGAIAVWVNAWRFIEKKPGLHVLIEDTNTWIGVDADGVWRATMGDQSLAAVLNVATWEITWDGSLGNAAVLTLDQATSVMLTPINLRPGTPYILYVRQDGTGGRVMQFETAGWAFAGGSAPVITAAANALDIMTIVSPLGFAGKATVVSHVQNVS